MSSYAKIERLEHANELLKIISIHGRRFFHCEGRTAKFFFDTRGRVRYQDEYRGAIIYPYVTNFANRWRGFSNGGTLQSLVEALASYIRNGVKLDRRCMAPHMSYGDIWGYGEDAVKAVREAAFKLPIFATSNEGGAA